MRRCIGNGVLSNSSWLHEYGPKVSDTQNREGRISSTYLGKAICGMLLLGVLRLQNHLEKTSVYIVHLTSFVDFAQALFCVLFGLIVNPLSIRYWLWCSDRANLPRLETLLKWLTILKENTVRNGPKALSASFWFRKGQKPTRVPSSLTLRTFA